MVLHFRCVFHGLSLTLSHVIPETRKRVHLIGELFLEGSLLK